jgi:VanZ family protein
MRFNILPAILYACVILAMSSIPGKSFPDLKWLSYDKLLHVGEYLIFGIFVSHALMRPDRKRIQLVLLTLLIAVTFGAVDELYQNLIPGRLPSYRDWLANVVGVVTGSFLYTTVRFKHAQASSR